MTIEHLVILIDQLGLTETEAMNALQDSGIISDNCVWLPDIADADIQNAAEWLRRNYEL